MSVAFTDTYGELLDQLEAQVRRHGLEAQLTERLTKPAEVPLAAVSDTGRKEARP